MALESATYRAVNDRSTSSDCLILIEMRTLLMLVSINTLRGKQFRSPGCIAQPTSHDATSPLKGSKWVDKRGTTTTMKTKSETTHPPPDSRPTSKRPYKRPGRISEPALTKALRDPVGKVHFKRPSCKKIKRRTPN